MSSYSEALKGYLATAAGTQTDLAAEVKMTQAAISRYATGARLPNRETAEKIDKATGGKVSLSLWRAAAAEKFGLAA